MLRLSVTQVRLPQSSIGTDTSWTESPEVKQGTESPDYRLWSKVIYVLVAVLTNDHSSKYLFQKCVAAKALH